MIFSASDNWEVKEWELTELLRALYSYVVVFVNSVLSLKNTSASLGACAAALLRDMVQEGSSHCHSHIKQATTNMPFPNC